MVALFLYNIFKYIYPKVFIMKKVLYILFILTLMISCQKSRFHVPGKAKNRISIIRSDKEFFNTGKISDSAFFSIYSNNIMSSGNPQSEMFKKMSKAFREDSLIKQIYNDSQKEFNNVTDIEDKLTNSFYRMKYFFPSCNIPKVHMHISGFTQSIITAPGIISASIENYLGKDYPAYKDFFYPYMTLRMERDRIAADYISGWLREEFTPEHITSGNKLADLIIYEGKIAYTESKLLPGEPIMNILGFTKDQLDWCKKNEHQMWQIIKKNKHDQTEEQIIISRYLANNPETVYFPKGSPGRAVIWLGYNMVKKYMDKNKKTTLSDLISDTETEKIIRNY